MKKREKITKSFIDKLKPDGKSYYVFDSEVVGFGVRMNPDGSVVFVFQGRLGKGRAAQKKRWTLGKYGTLTPHQAREEAKEYAFRVNKGDDPDSKVSSGNQITFFEFCQFNENDVKDCADEGMYFTEHANLRRGSRKILEDKYQLRKIFKIGRVRSKPMIDFTRKDIIGIHNSMSETPAAANNALQLLSKIFNLAEDLDVRQQNTNPCIRVVKWPEEGRSRAPSLEELTDIGRALEQSERMQLESPSTIGLFRGLIISGRRTSELRLAKKTWIDRDNHLFRPPATKGDRLRRRAGSTKKSTIFPLPPGLLLIFDRMDKLYPKSEWIFPNPDTGEPYKNIQQSWRRIKRRAGITDLRIHDLRHGFTTLGRQALGGDLSAVMRLLGHSDIKITQRYDHNFGEGLMESAEIIDQMLGSAVGTNENGG